VVISIHISFILVHILFGFLFANRTRYFYPFILISGTLYALTLFSAFGSGKSYSIPRFEIICIVSLLTISNMFIGKLIRLRKTIVILPILSLLIIVISVDDRTRVDSVKSFFVDPYHVESNSKFTAYSYRFKSNDTIYIPNSLYQAHLYIDSIFNKDGIDWEKSSPIEYHFSLGMWMRNNWGLWGNEGALYKELSKMGYSHPDNMSAFILDSYFIRKRRLSSSSFNQIEFYNHSLDSIKNDLIQFDQHSN
jgi:hypothetical protein